MRGLRREFGVIVGAALVPLLIFSIWQSLFNYNTNRDRQLSLMRETARTSVSEIIGAFNTTQSIMTVAGRQVTSTTCKQVISQIMDSVPIIYNIVMTTADGAPFCEGVPIRTTAFFPIAQNFVSVDDAFYMNSIELPPADSEIERLIVITHGVHNEAGELYRLVFAGFDENVISALKNQKYKDEGLEIGIYDISGNHLLGVHANVNDGILKNWFSMAASQGEFQASIVNSEKKKREILALSTDAFDTFIVVTLPEKKWFSREVFSSFTSLLIPILAWVLTLLAIWWASSKLVLRPIDSMRRQLEVFKSSSQHPRLTFSRPPPRELSDLAQSFNDLSDVVEQQEVELKTSLMEKETLLREIHHRVKNNLQIIISLLNMQERKISDKTGLAAITESRNRVNAIALVHKALYESETLKFIDMDVFLRQLIGQLERALLLDTRKIELSLDVDCSPMESEQAMPVSLFLVEAFTNSVKHSAADKTEVKISLLENQNEISVSVLDNGGGTEMVEPQDKPGMGSRLMAGFARQLGGQYTGGPTDDGYAVHMAFQKRA